MFGVQESHSQQHQVRLYFHLAVGNLGHAGTPVLAGSPLHPHGVQLFQLAVFAGKRLGQDVVVADSALLVGRRRAEDIRPLRPGIIRSSLFRGFGQQLKLINYFGALPVGGTQTVRPGISAAQNDYPFALGGNVFFRVYCLTGQQLVLLGQVIHCQVDAVQFPARHRQFPRLGGTSGEANRVKPGQDLFHRIIKANVDPGAEFYPFVGHQLNAAVYYSLVQLEIGNPQHQQSADVVGPLKYGDRVTGAVKLLGRGQSRRAGTDYGNPFAGAMFRRLRPYPAFLEAPVRYFLLNVFDRHRVGVDIENTGGLAGGRANPAGELREVVGAEQNVKGFFPFSLIYMVVKFRDNIAQRATHMAEGNGAVHTATALLPGAGFRPVQVKFLVVSFPLGYWAAIRRLPPGFHKSGRFTHV